MWPDGNGHDMHQASQHSKGGAFNMFRPQNEPRLRPGKKVPAALPTQLTKEALEEGPSGAACGQPDPRGYNR